MNLKEKIKDKNKKLFSFEFYPPKNDKAVEMLYESVKRLKSLKPDFVSITNSTVGPSYNTAALSILIKEKFDIEVVSHMTCIAHTKREISRMLSTLEDSGIKNILALRGDEKNIGGVFKSDYKRAYELVRDIRKGGNFLIGVAAYPEKHPEAKNWKLDLDNLKRKEDAGADFAITQLFFKNEHYFAFLDKCLSHSITLQIIPGIMPVTNYKQIIKFTKGLKVAMPRKLLEGIEKYSGNEKDMLKFSIDYARRQCESLLKQGAKGIHFYTLNRSNATMEILKGLK